MISTRGIMKYDGTLRGLNSRTELLLAMAVRMSDAAVKSGEDEAAVDFLAAAMREAIIASHTWHGESILYALGDDVLDPNVEYAD